LLEKFENEDESAFEEETKQIKGGLSKTVGFIWKFAINNWLLILIAYFSFQTMIYAQDAARYAMNAEDYAADASSYSRAAADYSEIAADYSEQAADDTSYLRIWSY